MAPTHAVIGAAGARVALALLCMLLAPLLLVSSLAVSPLAHTTASTLLTSSSTDDQHFQTFHFHTTVRSSINENYNFNPDRRLQEWANVIDPNASKFIIKNEKDLRTENTNERNGPIPIKRFDTSIDLDHHRVKHIQGFDTKSIVSLEKNVKDDQLTSVTRTYRLSDDSEVHSVRKASNNSSDIDEFLLTNATTRIIDRSSVLSKYSDLGINRNRATDRKIVTKTAAIKTNSTKATSVDRNVTAEWSNHFNGKC